MENTFEFRKGDLVSVVTMPGTTCTVKKDKGLYLILTGPFRGKYKVAKSLVKKIENGEPKSGRAEINEPSCEGGHSITLKQPNPTPIFQQGDSVTYNGLTDRYFSIIKLSPDGVTALLEGYHGEFEQGLSCIWLPCHELTHIKDVAFIPQHQRPPKGLIPRKQFEEIRLESIDDAITRYIETGYSIPTGWVEERNEILLRLGGK